MKVILAALCVLLIIAGCSAAKKAAREQEALQTDTGDINVK
jgi:PBP1b-binding outer membrane lipoprotein LpoB